MNKHGYYQGSAEQPFHLSVGAVLYDAEGRIAVHHFDKLTARDATLLDFVVLMRETMEAGETIEATLHRGLAEEFGAKGMVKHFLGSLEDEFVKNDATITKTTLYFLVECAEFTPKNRDGKDPEASSQIIWLEPVELLGRYSEQSTRITYGTLDESLVVKRAKRYIKKN